MLEAVAMWAVPEWFVNLIVDPKTSALAVILLAWIFEKKGRGFERNENLKKTQEFIILLKESNSSETAHTIVLQALNDSQRKVLEIVQVLQSRILPPYSSQQPGPPGVTTPSLPSIATLTQTESKEGSETGGGHGSTT